MSSDITWILKKFDDLSPHELYAILQLRMEVFVVEQNCIFQDADNKDPACWHFMGWKNNQLIAYTRIVPPGIAYDLVSIGRVVTAPAARGGGLGRELMEQTIGQVNNLFGIVPIQVGAQVYLTHFYLSLGFQQSSAIYLEDGIEHMEMIRPI